MIRKPHQSSRKKGTHSRPKAKKRTSWVRFLILFFVTELAVFGGLHYLSQSRERALYPRPYYSYVSSYAEKYEVPESVIYAVMKTESSFDSDAKSGVGACGLMQMMPDTFTWVQRKMGEEEDTDEIFDPETNIRDGVYYLSWLYSHFENWETVYAAYNAGPTCVKSWLADPDKSENQVLTNIPYTETASYVKKVGTARKAYQNLYGSV